MKKIFCFILACLMILSLCACSASDEGTATEGATTEGTAGEGAVEKGLRVGFARASITPSYTVCLQGGSYKDRLSTGFLDMLFVTCIAVSDGTQTYLIYTADIKLGTGTFGPETRARVCAATGIPAENMYINGTHTHAGVAIRYNWDNADRYREDFYKAATKAAEKAIKDLSPAEISVGTVMTENMAWVRHYTMNDGTVSGSNFGSRASGETGHTFDADNEMQLVLFTRSEADTKGKEKKNILLASFPAHATFTEAGTEMSADFPGPFRDYVEETADIHCAYFIGSAGDQVPSSRIEGESFSKDYRSYGKELGRYAVEALSSMTKLEGDAEIKAVTETYVGATHKGGTDPQRVGEANEVKEAINAYGANSQEVKNLVAKYGFSSYLDASWTVKRAGLPEERELEMKIFAIGDLSFVFAPYEMFGANGRYIKYQTPYAMTFIATCSEGDGSYIPTEAAFDYNCYESQCSYFARGTAEILAEKYVTMLTALKSEA